MSVSVVVSECRCEDEWEEVVMRRRRSGGCK